MAWDKAVFGNQTKGELLPTGSPEPGWYAVWCGQQVGTGVWGWLGLGKRRSSGSGAVSEGTCSSMRKGGEVPAPPRRTLTRCPLLPPSPDFWSVPGFLPGVRVVFQILLALVFAPLWSVSGSLRCWHCTELCGGCFRGLPTFSSQCHSFPAGRPRAGWTLNSFTFPSLWSRWRSDGWSVRAGRRPVVPLLLLESMVLGAENRPGFLIVDPSWSHTSTRNNPAQSPH